MDVRFDQKVIVVTGASTGIGAAIARGFGEAGGKVVVNYRKSAKEAEDVVASIHKAGGEAISVKADVSKAEEVDQLFQKTIDAYGGLDILVNNAGALMQRTPIEEMPEELWDLLYSVNIKSVFLCSKKAIPLLKQRGKGKIINVSSLAAKTGGGGGSVGYASTKGAIATFTKGLAKELAADRILVNAIAPGIITTPLHELSTPEKLRAQLNAGIPLGREGAPEECAGAVLFLCSNSADYITGETIEVNGGILMD
ncbi:SDR family NAD(P)-dependent oxidoreductase [Halalkalibacter oceani]|uniref:3-oxoacyl-ACP reductase FabG n=1 Tax=Halalkalibacter oceani TaxID=1653776 RepID=A0A9X2INH1_9BACI|nr:3-oxoacyl-ACP reductase family protein [Halalkalibacter oceani]MCM3714874.1 3-oxoacyl-ACP reductase FabG [Halalkalibacter oceani]